MPVHNGKPAPFRALSREDMEHMIAPGDSMNLYAPGRLREEYESWVRRTARKTPLITVTRTTVIEDYQWPRG